MPMINNMTRLLNKAERRLGTKMLNLPESMGKDVWGNEVIFEDTLDTFSRFFPHKIPYVLGPENKKGEYYLIDENICEGYEIMDGGDIDWKAWSAHYPGLLYGGVNSYDMMTSGIDFETLADVQMMADHVSAFTNGIYLEYHSPNLLKLNIVISSSFLTNFQRIPINLYVKHAPNLMTIDSGKMEDFELLAFSDIATFLLEQLKMYDDTEIANMNINLRLDTIRRYSDMRPELIDKFKAGHVSAANFGQPIFYTIN